VGVWASAAAAKQTMIEIRPTRWPLVLRKNADRSLTLAVPKEMLVVSFNDVRMMIGSLTDVLIYPIQMPLGDVENEFRLTRTVWRSGVDCHLRSYAAIP
jgi:hypothetical protein